MPKPRTVSTSPSSPTYTILHGEARTTISQLLRPNSFDGCLCDPPYGFTAFTHRKTQTWEKEDVPPMFLWAEVHRILRPGAFLVAASGAKTYHKIASAIESAGFEVLDMFMWIYSGANATGTREGYRLRPAHEPYVIAKKPGKTTSYNTGPWEDRSPPVDLATDPALGISCIGSSYFQCGKAPLSERGTGNDHPTLKPLALTEHLARLILPGSSKRMIVPFGGVGSEVIGALRAGWEHVTSIELEAKYVRCARTRIPTFVPGARAI